MIALLKKDRAWLLTTLVIGLGVFTAVLFDRRADYLWIGGELRNAEEIVAAWWICACLFGLYAGLRDRMLGTREYLLHRPVSATRVFWTRCLGCVLVMAAAVTVPYLLMWWNPFQDDNRAVWEFGWFWIAFALSTSMWPLFAVGMYAATVPASRVSAVFQTALVGIPVIYIAWRLQFPLGDAWEVSPWFYVGMQALLAMGLLALSARHFARGQDRDRDIAVGTKTRNAILLAVCAALLAAIPISEFQRSRYHRLIWSYPTIYQLEDGSFALIKRDWDKQHEQATYRLVDENHEPVGEVFDFDMATAGNRWRHAYPLTQQWPDFERQLEPDRFKERDGPALGGIRRHLIDGWNADADAFLQLPEGVVEAYGFYYSHRPGEKPHPPWRWTFSRPDGRGFSPRTECVGNRGGGPFLLLDPADSSLWLLEKMWTGSEIRPVSLPDGDRAKHVSYVTIWPEAKDDRPAPRPSASRPGVIGEKGSYYWDEDRFVLAPDPPWLEKKRAPKHPRPWPVARVGDDPIEFEVELRDDEGVVRFRAAYEPKAARENFNAGLVYLGAVVRSPAFTVASLAAEAPGAWPLDPVVASGGRPWLVGLNLAFMAGLVWLGRRRLRKFRAGRPTVWLWTILIALGGLAVYVVFAFLERKRAHAPVAVLDPMDVPPLLIHTA